MSAICKEEFHIMILILSPKVIGINYRFSWSPQMSMKFTWIWTVYWWHVLLDNLLQGGEQTLLRNFIFISRINSRPALLSRKSLTIDILTSINRTKFKLSGVEHGFITSGRGKQKSKVPLPANRRLLSELSFSANVIDKSHKTNM